jgi:hypothetical protein
MTQRAVSTTLIGCAFALALSAVACGDNRRSTGTAGAAGTPAGTPAAAPPSMTLTGCLQKGDGRSDYILTDVNTTPPTVGTSGSAPSGSPGSAGQEQMRSAARAYRIDGDRDTLEPLVGKQVRVTASMAERSDPTARTDDPTLKDRDRTKLDQDDLAKVKIASVDEVSGNCGASNVRP